MSNFKAIAGVSASLQTLLADRMELPADVTRDKLQITVGMPWSLPKQPNQQESPGVNLFLYRQTENGSLSNQEIPGMGQAGAYGFPPLSLDLHYLITAYGSSDNQGFLDEKLAQILLGSAMRVLHDVPVITEDLRTAADEPVLDVSLRGAFEKIKITREPVGMEDLSKVWTALQQPFRLSATYLVTVVQIESQRARRFPQPVGAPPDAGPAVYVVQYRFPRIEEVRVRRTPTGPEEPYPYARIGDTLILRGYNMSGQAVQARLGSIAIPVTPLSDRRIEVQVPDDLLPGGAVIPEDQRLQPGPQTVEVVLGVPELPQAGFHSNAAVFVLVPSISSASPALGATPRTLTVQGKRLFLAERTGETVLGPAIVAKPAYIAPSPAQIIVPLPDILPAWPAACLLSGDLATFPNLSGIPVLQVGVKIGTSGPFTCTLSRPVGLADAAERLQAGIRGQTANGGPTFAGARVTVVGTQLAIVPGYLHDVVTVTKVGGNQTADQLKLTAAAGAQSTSVYLSGSLAPFPVLTASQPQVTMKVAAITHTVPFASRPTTLEAAATILQAAIQGAGPENAFKKALVSSLEDQLLILPGAAGAVIFSASLADATTVNELQLVAHYMARVRVNGAESIDAVYVDMP